MRIFAGKLSKASKEAAFNTAAGNIRGSFALVSTKDPQSITLHVDDDCISISSGIGKEVKVTIHMDFDRPGKPRVEGLLRHPFMAFNISRLMNFKPAHWIEAAERFWEIYHEYPGMPGGIKIDCLDEDRSCFLGKAPEDVRICGNAINIAAVFSGDAVFVQSVMTGKIAADTSFQHAVVLSDVTLQMLLGDPQLNEST